MKIRMMADVEIDGDPDDAYFAQAEKHFSELDTLTAFIRTLPDNIIIFDVGANIGLSTIAMAFTKPSAKIYAFEPSPINFRYLETNVSRFPNVEVVQAALSNEEGTLHFHEAAFAAGSHVVGEGHMNTATKTVAVQGTTLDRFSLQRNLVPDFIKLDVEGHEPEVLAGARRVLAAHRPPIYMEFNSWTLNALAGHSPAAFARALWSTFDVEGYSDPMAFLHENLTLKTCVSDIVIRIKEGVEVPTLEAMSFSQSALRSLAQSAKGEV